MNVSGQVITFNSQPGWTGQELIELQLNNTSIRLNRAGDVRQKASRTNGNQAIYQILVSVIDPTPVIVAYSDTPNEISISWNPVPGADTYRVFSSDTINGVFTDVTNSGSLIGLNGIMIWQQSTTANQAFYYVKAIKNERTLLNRPIHKKASYFIK